MVENRFGKFYYVLEPLAKYRLYSKTDNHQLSGDVCFYQTGVYNILSTKEKKLPKEITQFLILKS